MKENRKNPRFDVSLTARLPGVTANHEVRISDLSESGCYVDNIAQVFEGDTIIIAILAANNEWVELQGVVAHRSPGLGFGMQFVNLQEVQLRWIHSNISQHREGPSSLTLKESDVICYQLV